MPHTDREQINITLTEEKKQRWEEYLEESNEHDFMAQFIRFCVEHYISSDGNSSVSPELQRTVERTDERAADIQRSVQSISETVDDVDDKVTQPSVFEGELPTLIITSLPTREQLEKTQRSADETDDPIVTGNPPYVQTGLPRHIADHLDEQSYEVQELLSQLSEEMSFIGSTIKDGEIRYFKTH